MGSCSGYKHLEILAWQLVEVGPYMTHLLKLSVKDFKIAIANVLKIYRKTSVSR